MAERRILYGDRRAYVVADSLDDLRRFVDGGLLRQVWPRMFLPRRVRDMWEGRFPELVRAA